MQINFLGFFGEFELFELFFDMLDIDIILGIDWQALSSVESAIATFVHHIKKDQICLSVERIWVIDPPLVQTIIFNY